MGKNVIGTIVPPRDRAGFDLTQMIKDIGAHPERYVSKICAPMRAMPCRKMVGC